MTIRVAVIGAGQVGARRAAIAAESARSELVVVADVDEGRAKATAEALGSQYATDWQEVIARADVDAVVVSTSNKFLTPISVQALQAGKHVLCEKPPGRTVVEAAEMAVAAQDSQKTLKIGFTLRFHPGIRQAHQVCQHGDIGPLYFLRAVYGHGGRPGYDREWRGNAELAGGGELLDQGVHILDLCRWYLGEMHEVVSVTPRWFWDVAPLEDNAFVLLRNSQGQVANFHTSWTQWKNRFSFEVFGRDGYVKVEGLGGSYGVETLTVGHRLPESGPPREEQVVFDGADSSWQDDWEDFMDAIETGRPPEVSGVEGVEVMKLVEAVYRASRDSERVVL